MLPYSIPQYMIMQTVGNGIFHEGTNFFKDIASGNLGQFIMKVSYLLHGQVSEDTDKILTLCQVI